MTEHGLQLSTEFRKLRGVDAHHKIQVNNPCQQNVYNDSAPGKKRR